MSSEIVSIVVVKFELRAGQMMITMHPDIWQGWLDGTVGPQRHCGSCWLVLREKLMLKYSV